MIVVFINKFINIVNGIIIQRKTLNHQQVFFNQPWLASNNHIGFRRLIRVQQQLYNKDQIVRIGPKRDSRKMKFLPCADGNNCRHPAQSNNVKAKLVQLKAFTEWKYSKTDHRIHFWIVLKEKIGKISGLYNCLIRKKIIKAFSKMHEFSLIWRLKSTFDADIQNINDKYKLKLQQISQEINELNEK